jgi:hypothetical protein
MYTVQAFRTQFGFRLNDPRARIAAWYEGRLGLAPDEAASQATKDFARMLARAYAKGPTYRELGDAIGISASRVGQLIHKGERIQAGHRRVEVFEFPPLPEELGADRSRARRMLHQLERVTVTLRPAGVS